PAEFVVVAQQVGVGAYAVAGVLLGHDPAHLGRIRRLRSLVEETRPRPADDDDSGQPLGKPGPDAARELIGHDDRPSTVSARCRAPTTAARTTCPGVYRSLSCHSGGAGRVSALTRNR